MDDTGNKNIKGCEVYYGLTIIRKYLPEQGIEGADYDVIYSVDIDGLIKAGITTEDVKNLAGTGWFIQDDEYLAHLV